MKKAYPRGVVTTRYGRWWWRIDRSPALVEYACPHTFGTADEARQACLADMERRADPVGYMVRALANLGAARRRNRRKSDR
jgi:hypothetical protein